MHLARLLDRGYDQTRLIASALEAAGHGRVAPLLRRARPTPPQGAPYAPGRRANVRGAFRAVGRPPRGTRVWIVDDVVTSGATVDACAEVLRAAGAGRPAVLALARA